MIHWNGRALIALWGLVLFAAGCSSTGPEIKGTVTLDGKPLGNARVTFQPIGPASNGAFAICDANGNFDVIPQAEGRTLEPGEYAVLVSRKTDAQGNVPKEEDYGQLEAAGQLVESVPKKYTELPVGGTPAYTVSIKEGSVPPLEIKLTSS